jgi:hypothetical protein
METNLTTADHDARDTAKVAAAHRIALVAKVNSVLTALGCEPINDGVDDILVSAIFSIGSWNQVRFSHDREMFGYWTGPVMSAVTHERTIQPIGFGSDELDAADAAYAAEYQRVIDAGICDGEFSSNIDNGWVQDPAAR